MPAPKIIYLGYEKVDYQDRNGNQRTGYNVFVAEQSTNGYKPILRFNTYNRSRNYFFLSPESFGRLNIQDVLPMREIKEIIYDQYGNMSRIQFV